MGLGAGGNLERGAAVDRRHLHGRPQRGQRRGDVDDGDEVVLVAHKPGVLAHVDLDVEVTGGTAAIPGVAAARDANPLAVLDPGRDVD